VTNNQAEGINYVLKDLQEWWEAPVDCMVLALYYLQGYYRVEIARAQQGLGNYHLHSKFPILERTQPSLIPEDNTYAPEKIVERIKGSLDCGGTLWHLQCLIRQHNISKDVSKEMNEWEEFFHSLVSKHT